MTDHESADSQPPQILTHPNYLTLSTTSNAKARQGDIGWLASEVGAETSPEINVVKHLVRFGNRDCVQDLIRVGVQELIAIRTKRRLGRLHLIVELPKVT